MRKILVLGATSAIGGAAARLFAADGDRMYLTGRHPGRLKIVMDDLEARGARVEGEAIDLNDVAKHAALVERAASRLDGIDIALLAHGVLMPRIESPAEIPPALDAIQTNYGSCVSLLAHIAEPMKAAGRGTIAVVTSVAGDRGRQSNYLYGSTKAAMDAYLSGLRNHLFPSGVHVVTIKPGFVDTPMIAHMKRNPLWASPETVGRAIRKAVLSRQDIVYVPGYWRWILAAVKLVPEPLFKRLKL